MFLWIKELILSQSLWAKDVGLLIIRAGIGAVFIKHGFGKIMQGPQSWSWLGSQMAVVGITFLPVFWGLCAVATEFLGGCALVLGIYTRIAAIFMACVMFVAIAYHLNKGDAFTVTSHSISLLIVFIGLIVAGSGRFSIDWFLSS